MDAGPGSLTAAEYCPALSKAVCDREAACGFIDPAQSSACLSRVAAACNEAFKQTSRSYDPVAGKACVDALSSYKCIEGNLIRPVECSAFTVFKPAASLGAVCASSPDCTQGVCYGGTSQCKTCLPYVGIGAGCNFSDQRCDPANSYCDTPADAGADAGDRCLAIALKADGQPCDAPLYERECSSGYCNFTSLVPDGGPDLCGKVLAGQPCGYFEDCVDTAYCKGFYSVGFNFYPGVCQPRIALGQACVNEANDDGCSGGGTCLDGACKLIAPYSQPAGAECEQVSRDCQDTLFCKDYFLTTDGGPSLRKGTCTPRQPAGSSCSYSRYYDTDCVDSAVCSGSVCVARQASGGVCKANFECKDYLTCPRFDAGTGGYSCKAYSQPGDPCGPVGVFCADGANNGFCKAVPDAGSLCSALLPAGSPCTSGSQCAAQKSFENSRCFASVGDTQKTCQPSCFP